MDQTIRISGEREEVVRIKQELEAQFAEHNIVISEPKLHVAKFGSREPYRQSELFDILIAIATNLATAVVYDQLKKVLQKYQDNKKVEVHYEVDKQASPTKDNLPHQKVEKPQDN
ncbi:MAG: hypothetical protein ACJ788_21025 [Ktedonobacteraceae bacterium]